LLGHNILSIGGDALHKQALLYVFSYSAMQNTYLYERMLSIIVTNFVDIIMSFGMLVSIIYDNYFCNLILTIYVLGTPLANSINLLAI
jgi:hypothetical protein